MNDLKTKAKEALQRLTQLDAREVTPRLTLLLLVLYGGSYWDLKVPTVIVAALGMIAPPLARKWWYWAIITVIVGFATVPRLYVVDNHKVLMLWWCFALTVSMRAESRLRWNARLLIGLCFVLAAGWKFATLDFVDGSFLHHTMLADGRFATFSRLVAGVSSDALRENADMLGRLYAGQLTSVNLADSGASDTIAVGMTIWTLIIEGFIGISFLLANRSVHLRWARNVALVGFIATTYPIATVIGFGWLLTIMGYAQCRRSEAPAKIAYLVIFIMLQVYMVPWTHVLDL